MGLGLGFRVGATVDLEAENAAERAPSTAAVEDGVAPTWSGLR